MIRFKVETMGCGGCAESVTGARVEVDLARTLVTVSDTNAPAARIAQAIAAAGYPAAPVLTAAQAGAAATRGSRRPSRPSHGHGPAPRTGVIPYP